MMQQLPHLFFDDSTWILAQTVLCLGLKYTAICCRIPRYWPDFNWDKTSSFVKTASFPNAIFRASLELSKTCVGQRETM